MKSLSIALLPRFGRYCKQVQLNLFPQYCVLCLARIFNRLPVCQSCWQSLPWLEHACHKCGLPITNAERCAQCYKSPPNFDRLYALWTHEEPMRCLVKDLKFNKRLDYAYLFGAALAKQLQEKYQSDFLKQPDWLVPVPLHAKRVRERGFNQSLLIAKTIGKKARIPVLYKSCIRRIHTEPQLNLPEKQRRRNILGAFEVVSDCSDKHIAIVDDVVTTGSTVGELAKQFKLRGARQVDVYCISRTVR